jgi:hypothetical protein
MLTAERISMNARFASFALVAWLSILSGYLVECRCFGQGTIYFDRSGFDAAISGIIGSRTDLDFQPPFPPGGIDQGEWVLYPPPLTMSGITFLSGGPLLIRWVSIDGNRVLNGYDSLSPLIVNMNAPTLAFGADFGSLVSSSFLATVTLNDGRVFTFTAPADPNLTFFGFVTQQPFSTLTFSDGGLIGIGLHEEILDNITVVQVPEPAVWVLLALGAFFLGWRWRKVLPRR